MEIFIYYIYSFQSKFLFEKVIEQKYTKHLKPKLLSKIITKVSGWLEKNSGLRHEITSSLNDLVSDVQFTQLKERQRIALNYVYIFKL